VGLPNLKIPSKREKVSQRGVSLFINYVKGANFVSVTSAIVLKSMM
jgi:hypothetical protein